MDPSPARSILPTYLLPVFLYARLSKNRDGTKESVRVQLVNGRAYCARTWPGRPIVEWSDDGISASDENAHRPGYEGMLDAIRRGQAGAVVAKTQARVTRRREVWDAFKVACIRADIDTLHTYVGGNVDLADGQSLAGDLLNLFDEDNRKKIQRGIADTFDLRADEGKPHSCDCFGYRRVPGDGIEQDEAQAAEVVAMAQKILAGHSLAAIVADLRERKIPTARDGQWAGTTVRGLLTSPMLAGWIVRRGVMVKRGTWKPILDDDTWNAVCAALRSPRPVVGVDGKPYHTQGPVGRRARCRLLAGGLLRCGRCGAAMVGTRRDSGTAIYSCRKDKGGCNGLSILAEPLEKRVAELFLAEIDTPRFRRRFLGNQRDVAERAAVRAELAALEARRNDMGRLFARGKVSAKAMEGFEDGAASEQVELEQRLARLGSGQPGRIDLDALATAWEYMTLAERQAALREVQTVATVAPASTFRGFDPERVAVTFLGQAPAASARSKPRRNRSAR